MLNEMKNEVVNDGKPEEVSEEMMQEPPLSPSSGTYAGLEVDGEATLPALARGKLTRVSWKKARKGAPLTKPQKESQYRQILKALRTLLIEPSDPSHFRLGILFNNIGSTRFARFWTEVEETIRDVFWVDPDVGIDANAPRVTVDNALEALAECLVASLAENAGRVPVSEVPRSPKSAVQPQAPPPGAADAEAESAEPFSTAALIKDEELPPAEHWKNLLARKASGQLRGIAQLMFHRLVGCGSRRAYVFVDSTVEGRAAARFLRGAFSGRLSDRWAVRADQERGRHGGEVPGTNPAAAAMAAAVQVAALKVEETMDAGNEPEGRRRRAARLPFGYHELDSGLLPMDEDEEMQVGPEARPPLMASLSARARGGRMSADGASPGAPKLLAVGRPPRASTSLLEIALPPNKRRRAITADGMGALAEDEMGSPQGQGSDPLLCLLEACEEEGKKAPPPPVRRNAARRHTDSEVLASLPEFPPPHLHAGPQGWTLQAAPQPGPQGLTLAGQNIALLQALGLSAGGFQPLWQAGPQPTLIQANGVPTLINPLALQLALASSGHGQPNGTLNTGNGLFYML